MCVYAGRTTICRSAFIQDPQYSTTAPCLGMRGTATAVLHPNTHDKNNSNDTPAAHTSSEPSQWQQRVLLQLMLCVCVFVRMDEHSAVTPTKCLSVCVSRGSTAGHECPLLAVFKSQSPAEAAAPVVGSGCFGPLGSALRPARPCPCLANPPRWALLLHPHSTCTP